METAMKPRDVHAVVHQLRMWGVEVSRTVEEDLVAEFDTIKPRADADLFPGDLTLDEARAVIQRRRSEGLACPLCDQNVKVYRRKLGSATVRTMIVMMQHAGSGYVHVPDLLGRVAPALLSQGGYATMGHWWGLLEESPECREDGSKSSGKWRVTEKGVRFLHQQLRVPKYALLYNDECLGFDGPEIHIGEALGNKFDYAALMAGV